LRALGRLDQASEAIERAVSWARANGEPDGWFHEEAAEISAALGREDAAREHARLALPLLFEADGSLADDAERLGRLRRLAGET
jgi:tetratricopeptide (TPR) repeat protein